MSVIFRGSKAWNFSIARQAFVSIRMHSTVGMAVSPLTSSAIGAWSTSGSPPVITNDNRRV
jgi:hypothetical protein